MVLSSAGFEITYPKSQHGISSFEVICLYICDIHSLVGLQQNDSIQGPCKLVASVVTSNGEIQNQRRAIIETQGIVQLGVASHRQEALITILT